jgi:hypothetical protein
MFNYFAKQNEQYSKYHFWQYKNHPVVLYTNEVIDQKRDYIHHSPVRAGLVASVQDYIYSSACQYSPLKVMEF